MKIKKEIIDNIVNHAKKEAPIEACGYLAEKDGVICKHYELINIDGSEDHFSFDPKEQFATVKDARSNGLEISAVYHSHPVSPARPSKEDIKLAFDPNINYVIVSLADDNEDVKSYRIIDSKVSEEAVSIE